MMIMPVHSERRLSSTAVAHCERTAIAHSERRLFTGLANADFMARKPGEFRKIIYSALKLLTGLAFAALIAWKLMVSRATSKAMSPAKAKTHQLMGIR